MSSPLVFSANSLGRLHSEGRIVTTLFGLLFWDVIFAPVSGAFETPYQSAPLDIAEDSFYFARRALANARLKEIENGKGTEVFLRTWDAHVESKTFCVGVKWELLQRGDFVQIMEVSCDDIAGERRRFDDQAIVFRLHRPLHHLPHPAGRLCQPDRWSARPLPLAPEGEEMQVCRGEGAW